MKYRLKNAEVEAVQWDGSEEALGKIREMFPEHEPYRTERWNGVIINGVSFYPGHWILPDLGLMDDEEFQELYEPVTEPETCGWKKDVFGVWESDCGYYCYGLHGADYETPTNFYFTYCPKCGRKIEERA